MKFGSSLLAVPGVRHAFFTREGGVSNGIYASLNGGVGSNDDPAHVAENRRRMAENSISAHAFSQRAFQIHSPDVVVATEPWDASRPRVDAMVTKTPGLALGVSAADCGPVLFVDPQRASSGRRTPAGRARWRRARIDHHAMEGLGATRGSIIAAIGP